MNEWVLVPLGVLAVCALWIWLANLRPRVGGVVWPAGLSLAGPVLRPDIEYDGTVVIGASADFGRIRCRSLVIARGADVTVGHADASRVRVDGALSVAQLLVARKRLDVRGTFTADEVTAPRIQLRKRAVATVLVVNGAPKIERHPGATVKGFFSARGEMPSRQPAPQGAASEEPRTIHLLEA